VIGQIQRITKYQRNNNKSPLKNDNIIPFKGAVQRKIIIALLNGKYLFL
jgi:hypothetical protein